MPDKKGQNLADLIYGQDSIRPTEVKRPAALGLGQALQRGHEFVSKPFGYPNPPAEAISEFLGVPAIARTLERLGYGEPLTTGKGMTTKPKEDTVEALLSVAPMVPATKGMPVGAMFIGPKAKTWNKTAAELAVKMEQAGADPVDIWRQTGTFRGADGILRQEISDVGALHRGEKELKELSKEKKAQAQALRSSIAGVLGQKDLFPKALTEARRPAREEVKRLTEEAAALQRNPQYTGHSAKFALEHPELYAAYPELADVKIVQGGSGGPGTRASLSAIPGAMEVDLYDLGLKSNPRSSLLHEMQHAVQTLEGMGPGGNPALAFKDPKAFEILEELRKKASIPMTFEEYAKHLSHIPEEQLQSAYEKYVKDIPNAVKAMDRDLQSQAATEYYKRLSGEAEARATQAREPMGPTQRRQEFPYSSYDVLPEDLIVKSPITKADGGEVHMDKGGAAFGVFPQMKPRRSRQDPEAAKQVPVDLARGFAAGALGMPGDVESLIRLLPGLSEETILPTSEDILKRIPGGSDTPASRAASGLGILGGGFYTGPGSAARAVSSVAGALPKAARDFVQAAGQPAVNVIKPKGGNWLTGSVEKALAPLKPQGLTEESRQHVLNRIEAIKQRGFDPSEEIRDLQQIPYTQAIHDWIDRNLANYVKKEMATPEDPVRRLAEQGIIHAPSEQIGINRYRAPDFRTQMGTEQLGKSEAAKAWENATDVSLFMPTASERKVIAKDELYSDFYQPWMEKVDPNTRIFHPRGNYLSKYLGFDHIIDVLREDLATGRIRPEQLNKVSMEQAVRRTYEYDQELAKKMAEATAAARTGLPVYKEYPEKYRWIELNRPGAFASESEAMGHSVRGYEPPKGHPDWTPASGDSGSPSYGHGGWEAIKSGDAKVYSLVDEKGQPHVTVEVGPPHGIPQEEAIDQAKKEGLRGQAFAERVFDLVEGVGSPPRISQIKGKQNAAPKEEYLPFVQDFVKSGQWSDVGDLRNTGLEDIANYKEPVRSAAEEVYPGQRFLTLEQIQPLVNAASEKKMESGGSVHISNNPDTMRLELAGGGTLSKVAMEALSKAKLLREEMAAKAALQAQYAKQMEGVYTKDMPTFEQWKATQEQQKAGGGGVDRVTPQDMLYLTSHPDFAKMSAQQQREAVVNMGDRELSERMKGKMAGGGTISKLAKLLRAPAKTRQEIEEIAERMAPQVTGEYVREKPKSAKTVAGKTAKQFEREKNLPVDIRATDVERVPEKVDVEKLKDQVAIGIAGDPTVTGKTLYGVGETRLASPAPQHGGPLYGLYNDEGQFWASGLGAARKVQNLARQASQQYDAPVLGNYVMMGPDSINYAQHFADANLQAIDLSKMTAKQVEGFNDLLRQGSPKSGPRPSFPGIEDKGSAYLHLAFDPELRKYFNQLMQQPTVTEKFGLPSGQDIRFAITEPELQNLERGVTGFSLGRMNPEVKAKALKLSEHPTYSHDIPGEFIGQTKYPIPYELSFPDTLKAIRENPKQAPHEFGSLKMVGPRQIIDQQLIDEIKAYEERMKALTGKKKGGAIKKAPGGEVTIPDMTDGGKVIDGGPFKKGGKVQFTDNLDTMRLAVGRK